MWSKFEERRIFTGLRLTKSDATLEPGDVVVLSVSDVNVKAQTRF